MDNKLIFLQPIFKEMIWGGNRLRTDFRYDIPNEHTGECWAIGAHPNGDCIVESEPYKGKRLSELWDEHRELFGNMEGDKFPLLIKIIDAKQDLSIQVHPDDEYARVNENGAYGKTECWYVLDCDKNASIVIGHNAKNKEELKDMINDGRWNELIREIPVHKDDFFQIEPGCLHAIKGGTLILETQQNSDVTYRVYDYDRLQNGKPRELHIKQSIDVIKTPFTDSTTDWIVKVNGGLRAERLVECQYYTVEKIDVAGCGSLEQTHLFTNVTVIEGSGEINGINIKKGNSFIIPFNYGSVNFEGNMSMLISYIE